MNAADQTIASDIVLEMKNINKRFPGIQALSGVNFTLGRGEIRALIGENGAGKSTLMNVLIGIVQPDEGEIILRGRPFSHSGPFEALKNGIGIVPQELNLIPDATVAENIFLNNERKTGPLGLIDWRETNIKANEFLNILEINIDVTKKLSELTPAYQQLVSIVRSLAFGSDILILDEPTASLTLHEVDILLKTLRRLRDSGKSIIFISHHLEEIKELCDNVTIMRDGKVIVQNSATADMSIDDMVFHMVNRKVEKTQKEHREISGDVFMEVRDLSRKREFENVSFQVKKGEIFGIAGLVGAGRTELINCIYGLTKKSSGAIFVEGKELNIASPCIAIEAGIGLVPEERRKMGIFPILSVCENLILPSYGKNSKAGVIQYKNVFEIAKGFIDSLKVKTTSIFTQIKNLSGGNQQRVIIGRWLAKNVKMLILDEPTRGIDVSAKSEIHRLIKDTTAAGMTVVVISSELDEVISLADRIMVMHEGKVKGFIEDLRGVTQEEILKTALN